VTKAPPPTLFDVEPMMALFKKR